MSTTTLRDLPTRRAPPLIGDSLTFLKDPAGFLAARTSELGPVFKINLFFEDVACFCGPDAFDLFLDDRYVTREAASPPHVQELMSPTAVPFLGGDAFKRRKALLMKVFDEDALDGYAPVLARVLDRYTAKWAETGELKWVPEITAMGMTIAGALFIGADPDKDDPEMADAFLATFGGMLSAPINLPFTRYSKALRSRDMLRERIAAALTEHEASHPDDAMTRMMAARTADGDALSADEIKVETVHFFGAYLAVIGGLSFLAMLLGQHDDVRQKLRAEVREQLPRGPITMASLRRLAYLDRVCKEARRVEPILPITFFGKVTEECAFDGVRIPKGIKAIGCIGPTLKDAKVFPDPDRFDPDRWATPSSTQERAWVPHGGGAHLTAHRCAGERLADMMLKTFAVVLLRDFDWSLPQQDLSPTAGQLFATPRSGLDVTFRRKPA